MFARLRRWWHPPTPAPVVLAQYTTPAARAMMHLLTSGIQAGAITAHPRALWVPESHTTLRMRPVGRAHALLHRPHISAADPTAVLVGMRRPGGAFFLPVLVRATPTRTTAPQIQAILDAHKGWQVGTDIFPFWDLPTRIHLHQTPWMADMATFAGAFVAHMASPLGIDHHTRDLRLRIKRPRLTPGAALWGDDAFLPARHTTPLDLPPALGAAFSQACQKICARHGWEARHFIDHTKKPYTSFAISIRSSSAHQQIHRAHVLRPIAPALADAGHPLARHI